MLRVPRSFFMNDSDPRPPFLRFPRLIRWPPFFRKHARLIAAFAGGLLIGAYLAVWIPAALSNRSDKSGLRELSRAALAEGLEYEDVLREPKVAVGRLVLWNVARAGSAGWRVDADANKPILWSSPEPADVPLADKHGQTVRVVALVRDVTPQGVLLSLQGKL